MCITQVLIYCLDVFSKLDFSTSVLQFIVSLLCFISCETFIEHVSIECICELEHSYVVNYCRICMEVPVRSSCIKCKHEFSSLLPGQLAPKLFSK